MDERGEGGRRPADRRRRDGAAGRAQIAVVNPAAGGGRCGRRMAAALAQLRSEGLEIEAWTTSRPGEAGELARRARDAGYRDFIAVGGDGTVFEVLNGLLPAVERPRIGILPLGTGNSFLRDFTDQGAAYAVRALIDGRSRLCDVVRLEHSGGELFFLNLVGLGFVADVAAVVNRRYKAWGPAAYILGVLHTLLGLRHRSVGLRVDGVDLSASPVTFVSVCNSRFTGGAMRMAPSAEVDDGLVDLIRVERLGRLTLLRTFPKIFRGTHVGHPAVSVTRARRIELDTGGELDVMVDGEVLTLEPRVIEVLPGAVEMRV